MSYTEDNITIEHEGIKHSATYRVESGVVSVIMKDKNGTFNGTSTFVDGSPPEFVARSLFCELLRDVGIF
jgi:hypothetical protein